MKDASIYNWVLDKFENVLEVDIRYYIKNSAYMMGQNILSVVFALMMSVLLARVLTGEEFGQYNFIISALGILSIITLPGINTAVNHSVAKGYEGSYRIGLAKKMRFSILGSFAIFIIAMYYFLFGSLEMSYGFVIGAILFPLLYPFQLFMYYLLGKKEFKRYSIYSAISVVVVSVSTMAITYLYRDMVIAITVYLGMTSVLNILFVYKTFAESKNGKVDKDMISYSNHLNVINLLGTVRPYIDKVIIGMILGFESLAIYTVASTVPKQSRPVWTIISNIIFPNLSQKSKKEAYMAVKKRLPWIVLLSFILTVGGIIILPPVILYFYSERYIESIFYFRIRMLLTFSGASYILSTLATSQKEVAKLYKMGVFVPLVTTVLLVPMTYFYGLLGASVTVALSFGILPSIFNYCVLYHGSDKES